jgi:hypothetical protein
MLNSQCNCPAGDNLPAAVLGGQRGRMVGGSTQLASRGKEAPVAALRGSSSDLGQPLQFHIMYVSVNTIRAGCRRRTKDAIAAVRHVFLEADHDGPGLLERIRARSGLPPPSYILQSSPGKVHVFWRATGFTPAGVERLERHLSRDLGTDVAATTCSQTTRLPGFRNHKRRPSHLVRAVYADVVTRYTPGSFPSPPDEVQPLCVTPSTGTVPSTDRVDRARRYLARVPPAVAGQHGDRQTFKVACKLVRGFSLADADALALFDEWNRTCRPPWTGRELRAKLAAARTYGTDPVGGLLDRS